MFTEFCEIENKDGYISILGYGQNCEVITLCTNRENFIFNSKKEVDQLISALKDVKEKLSEQGR